ncbi:winged helix-turn-helix domain-containing protein [Paraburkholderia sp. OAS925]|uniref:FadR/GntR family transcriptional regulator n=1 Tax=Paraburkholderia sp. OAS925 TaxID=2663827 RepID=UPI00366A6867
MSDKIQESLLTMIRERKLKPGDQIPTELELCELLGVGRSSLREAVAQMISHGLLSRIQWARHLHQTNFVEAARWPR